MKNVGPWIKNNEDSLMRLMAKLYIKLVILVGMDCHPILALPGATSPAADTVEVKAPHSVRM